MIGMCPASLAPGNRTSEISRKPTRRGQGPGRTSETLAAEDGKGAALLEALRMKEKGIENIASLTVDESRISSIDASPRATPSERGKQAWDKPSVSQ